MNIEVLRYSLFIIQYFYFFESPFNAPDYFIFPEQIHQVHEAGTYIRSHQQKAQRIHYFPESNLPFSYVIFYCCFQSGFIKLIIIVEAQKESQGTL